METVVKSTSINKAVKSFENKLASIKAIGTENMSQITRILSDVYKTTSSNEIAQVLKLSLLNDYLQQGSGLPIGATQTKQCLAYLLDQWKTPRGVERKNNPFGYREQDHLENFQSVYWVGNYCLNMQYGAYSPLFRIHTKDNEWGFLYYMQGGVIHIVG